MLDRVLANSSAGFAWFSQYLYLFILQINPALFRLFRPQDYILFLLGCAFSLFNHRAIMPFMLLIVLGLDYSKLNKKMKQWILLFFALQVLILVSFTRWG